MSNSGMEENVAPLIFEQTTPKSVRFFGGTAVHSKLFNDTDESEIPQQQ